jgi:Right handed beta helix region
MWEAATVGIALGNSYVIVFDEFVAEHEASVETIMKNRGQNVTSKSGTNSWSRRDVLSRGAGVLCVLALPEFVSRKALGQSTATFDFYISPTGSDSNPGTQASPWAITSLRDTNANNARMAGKKIGMIAGTYACSGLQSGSSPGDYSSPVLNLPQGTSGSPTVLQSVSGPGTVILDNSSSTTQNPLIGQNPNLKGYWTIDGLTMKGNNSAAQAFLVAGRYGQFSYTNSSAAAAFGITVQNCEIYNLYVTGAVGSNYGGMMMQGVQGAIIQNNYIHDITKPSDQAHCHCYEEYGCLGSKIHYNTFANCPGGGMDLKAGVSGADVAYNYFHNVGTATAGNGIAAVTGADGAEGGPNSPGTANVVHHNVFDGCGEPHAGDVNSTAAQNLYYYNNTIYDTRSGSNVVVDLRETSGNKSQFYNNILVTTANSGGGNYGVLAFSSGNFSNVSNNCYYLNSSSGGWGLGTLFNSLSAWQASSGSPDAHSIAANPVFASAITPGAGSAQFKLGSGSPCLGAGTGGVNIGAWDGAVTQIGSDFSASAQLPIPASPRLVVS